jgi:hypothetical protein
MTVFSNKAGPFIWRVSVLLSRDGKTGYRQPREKGTYAPQEPQKSLDMIRKVYLLSSGYSSFCLNFAIVLKTVIGHVPRSDQNSITQARGPTLQKKVFCTRIAKIATEGVIFNFPQWMMRSDQRSFGCGIELAQGRSAPRFLRESR